MVSIEVFFEDTQLTFSRHWIHMNDNYDKECFDLDPDIYQLSFLDLKSLLILI